MSGLGLAFTGLNFAARAAGVKSALAKVPPKVWIVLAIVIAVVTAFFAHQHYAHKALKAQYKAGYAQAMDDVKVRALKLKNKLDGVTTKISQLERNRNDEEALRIGRSTDSILRRGPGRAVCSQPAASPGQPVAPAGAANVAVGELPDGEGVTLIGMPFNDTVRFAGQCDLNRSEALSWRRWYDALVKAWPKSSPAASPRSSESP